MTKTIKEKAEEYSRCIASSEYTKEDFVSGANYVLDVIEEFIKHDFVYEGSLKRLIEQLKK